MRRSGARGAPEPPERPDPAGQASSGRGRFTNLLRLERVDSTNRIALELAAGGAGEGLVVLAREQTAGRGRRGRSWVAPGGSGLLCSILLRPPGPLARAHLAVAALALAAREAVTATSGVVPGLKWPNDLLVALPAGEGAGRSGAGATEGKLAGVLAEVAPGGGLVVGIGLNLDWPAPAPGVPPLPEGAVTLRQASGRAVSSEELLEVLLAGLERRYAPLAADGEGAAAELAAERRAACSTIGLRVRVELAGGRILLGRAVEVAEDGRLLLEEDGGGRRAVEAGEAVHLRPAT